MAFSPVVRFLLRSELNTNLLINHYICMPPHQRKWLRGGVSYFSYRFDQEDSHV